MLTVWSGLVRTHCFLWLSSFLFPVSSSNIQVRNTSSTSFLVQWQLQDIWPQEVRQFEIIYNRTLNGTAHKINVNASQGSVELRGLDVFTWYCVRILLVTLAGMERESPCVYGRTDQDGELVTTDKQIQDDSTKLLNYGEAFLGIPNVIKMMRGATLCYVHRNERFKATLHLSSS